MKRLVCSVKPVCCSSFVLHLLVVIVSARVLLVCVVRLLFFAFTLSRFQDMHICSHGGAALFREASGTLQACQSDHVAAAVVALFQHMHADGDAYAFCCLLHQVNSALGFIFRWHSSLGCDGSCSDVNPVIFMSSDSLCGSAACELRTIFVIVSMLGYHHF